MAKRHAKDCGSKILVHHIQHSAQHVYIGCTPTYVYIYIYRYIPAIGYAHRPYTLNPIPIQGITPLKCLWVPVVTTVFSSSGQLLNNSSDSAKSDSSSNQVAAATVFARCNMYFVVYDMQYVIVVFTAVTVAVTVIAIVMLKIRNCYSTTPCNILIVIAAVIVSVTELATAKA